MDGSAQKAEAVSGEGALAPPPGRLQRVLRPLILVVLVAAIAGGVILYRDSLRFPSTDDAYIQANVVQIAAKISGEVVRVHVENNQRVEADAPLFSIDPEPLAIAVDAAQAAFDEAIEAIGASGAGVTAAAARVREAEAMVAKARREAVRGRALRETGNLADAALDVRESSLKQSEASLAVALAELDRAEQQFGRSGKENARLRAASAALRKAQLDQTYAEVRAPASGWVSNVHLREGALLTPSRPVFSLVEDSEWWVDAHFKETDITRLRQGQKAKVTIDMYPDLTLAGVVESISAGSGAAFSLLPPENATGNWVKVTQRYTVRIKITDRPPGGTPLRIGASAKATVDTGA